jgi:HEAT repeat protein/uncharacterized protein YqfB (UPF0267 family)
MDQEYPKRSGFSGGVAKVLNAGGSAVVYAYDIGSSALGGLFSLVKKTPGLPRRVTGMFTGGLGTIRPSEAKSIEAKIKDYENKINALYYEIGKEGATHPETENPLEVEVVKKLVADVREYEKEIQRLKDRIAAIEAESKEVALQRMKRNKEAGKVEEKASIEQINKDIESAIYKAVRYGVFETASERAIFDKVAHDLLDSEKEIKILAAAELGKMGNEAAVPILCETARFDDPSLTSEVINSLINIGDARAISLFKAKINDPKYRVRIGCLRGLYKLASDSETMPFLIDALRDEHPEVRRTAATFIGWKDYSDALPALVQCLRDDDEKVRKAAASSLANIKEESSVLPLIKLLGDSDIEVREKALDAIRTITGEDISFDIHASSQRLPIEIEGMRDWWQKERIRRADLMATEGAEADSVEEGAPLAATVLEEPAECAQVDFSGEEAPTVEDVGIKKPTWDFGYGYQAEGQKTVETAEVEAVAQVVETEVLSETPVTEHQITADTAEMEAVAQVAETEVLSETPVTEDQITADTAEVEAMAQVAETEVLSETPVTEDQETVEPAEGGAAAEVSEAEESSETSGHKSKKRSKH